MIKGLDRKLLKKVRDQMFSTEGASEAFEKVQEALKKDMIQIEIKRNTERRKTMSSIDYAEQLLRSVVYQKSKNASSGYRTLQKSLKAERKQLDPFFKTKIREAKDLT